MSAALNVVMSSQPTQSMATLAQLLGEARPLFAGLEAGYLEALVALARSRSIKARKQVCQKGVPDHELFILLSGKLKVRTLSNEGKEAILGLIEEGEIFAEMALITASRAAPMSSPCKTARCWSSIAATSFRSLNPTRRPAWAS